MFWWSVAQPSSLYQACSLNKYDIIKRTPQSWIQNKDETNLNIREISFASVSEGGHSEAQICCAHILFSQSIFIIWLFTTGYEVMESRFHISMNFKFPKVDLLCQKRCYMQKHIVFWYFFDKNNCGIFFPFCFMAVVLLDKTVFQGQSLSQNLISSLNLLIVKQI